jgi:hypothetical protein
MWIGTTAAVALSIATLGGCDLGKITVNTTSGVLKRAQPALKAESDYELAKAAIPGTLKTVEGFWNVNPNTTLTAILAEGYCQYGTAFVEDDWELAVFAKDLDRIEELNARATRIFTRCLNYALIQLGGSWREQLFGTTEQVNKLVDNAPASKRDALMWAAYAMGSIINHNLDDIEVIAHLPTVKRMFARILVLDAKRRAPPGCKGTASDDCVKLALPHVAMGMLLTATGKDTGGDPAKATEHFQKAIQLTGGKMLLPKMLYGYRVGVITGDKELFRTTLLEVLATDPAIWPEQRLANEVAHRRAKRYLKREKEIF